MIPEKKKKKGFFLSREGFSLRVWGFYYLSNVVEKICLGMSLKGGVKGDSWGSQIDKLGGVYDEENPFQRLG